MEVTKARMLGCYKRDGLVGRRGKIYAAPRISGYQERAIKDRLTDERLKGMGVDVKQLVCGFLRSVQRFEGEVW